MVSIFFKILNMSLTAAYCALAVMALRFLLKKQPKAYSYALWLIVAFRLVCPVSFESAFSLMQVPKKVIPLELSVQEEGAVSTGNPRMDMAVNRAMALLTPVTEEFGVQGLEKVDETGQISVEAGEIGAGQQEGKTTAGHFKLVGHSASDMLKVLLTAGMIFWLAVAAGFFGYGIVSYSKVRRGLKGAVEAEPGVLVSEHLKTPFVYGLLRPVIFLPERLSEAERDYVLAHERVHITRKDYLIKPAAFLLLCVHWFNPVLWISFFLMCKDMEMSCDERVVKKLSSDHALETKKEYASTLLALASNHRYSFGGILAFGEGNMEKRIKNVLRYKKHTVFASFLMVAVVVAAAFVLMGNPKEGSTQGKLYGQGNQKASEPTPTAGEMVDASLSSTNDGSIYGVMAQTRMLAEEGKGYSYGIINGTVLADEYLTVELPEGCSDEISYYLKIENNAVQSLDFYMAELVGMEELEQLSKGNVGETELAWLEGYRFTELKDFLADGNLADFELAKQEFALSNEAGTGGYRYVYPLDNALNDEALQEKYSSLCGLMNQAKLSIYRIPQTAYTEEELKEYADWQQASLGTKLKENVYYGEIRDRQLVTPYFELWVPEVCVDKVSYLLTLCENSDGTKVVSGLQYFYAPATEVKKTIPVKRGYMDDYFEEYSWFGGYSFGTLEDYVEHAGEELLLDWAKRAGSTNIRDIEPLYQAECAPFYRGLYWVNEEGTGAYFQNEPSDVQWRKEFEAEYLHLAGLLKKGAYITFFEAPEAVVSEDLMKRLRESAGE